MEFLVLVWFVLEETESPFMVGLFGSLRFFGVLLAPLWGSLVDRTDRRRLLIGTRFTFFVVAAAILFLSLADYLLVWLVFLLVGFGGVNRAADQVTRQALLADLISGSRLLNGVAMVRLARDVGEMIGPLMGGVLLSSLGMSPAYVPIVVLMLVAASVIHWVRPPETRAPPVATSIFRNLALVGGYLRRQQVVMSLLFMAFLVNFTAFPINFGLLPVFARNELGTDALGLSALIWALATGGFIGTIILGSVNTIGRPGRFLILATLSWFGLLLIFSRSQSLGVSIALLLLIGAASSLVMVAMDMMLLRIISPEYRGRVMGLRSLVVTGLPVGLLVSGVLAGVLGPATAIVINALIGVALTLPLLLWARSLWRLE